MDINELDLYGFGHDDEDATGGTASPAEGAPEGTAPDSGQPAETDGSTEPDGAKEGEIPESKGADAEGQNAEAGEPAKDYDAEYAAIRNEPEFKKRFDAEVNQAFARRYAGRIGTLNDTIREQNEVLEELHTLYGTGSIAELKEKLKNAAGMWEDAAAEEGLTVEQFKQFRAAKRAQAQLEAQQAAQNREREAQAAAYQRAQDEMVAFGQANPGLNIETELLKYGSLDIRENPVLQMFQRGVPLADAFNIAAYQASKKTAAPESAPPPQKQTTTTKRPPDGAATSAGVESGKQELSEEDKKLLEQWH